MATQGINPAYLVDPSLYGDQQAIDQQRQLAQLLMTQGLQPMSGTDSVGGVAIRRSPLEGVAKLAALLSGQDVQGQANLANQALMQRQMGAVGQMFGMPGPQGGAPADGQPPQGQATPQALGAALGGAPAQGSATPAGALGLPGMSPMQSYMSYATNPDKYMEAYLKGYTPNDTTVQARQGGVDPQMANRLALIKASTDPKILGMQQAGMSPEAIYKSVFGEAAKGAEISRRPGEGYSNPLTGEAGMVGKIPEGANVTGAPGPNGQVSLVPMPGNTGIVKNNAAATGSGNAETEMVEFKLPDGTSMNMTKAQAIQLTRATMPPQSSVTPQSLDEQIRLVKTNGGQPISAADQPLIDRQVAKLQAQKAALPGFPSGQSTADKTTATKSAEDVTGNYNEMHNFATNSAPRNIGLLQSIQQLADKTMTGPGSDKVQLVNGILNTLGITPGQDQAQNYQIMSKNLNMLVGSQRMGASGGGSDALQNLLQAANPNNKEMNGPALKEAAEELIAFNRMQIAKDKALPNPNSTTPAQYQAAETKFAGFADPRLWQLEHAQSDAERTRILSLIPADQRASIFKKAADARKLGLLD